MQQDHCDFHLAHWLVQPSLCRLTCDTVVTRIRPQLMDMLVCLAARAGRTVTREELLAEVWSGRFVARSGLARCVAELRQALGDCAREPRVIETISKRGYRLIAPVFRIEAPPPASQRRVAAAADRPAATAPVPAAVGGAAAFRPVPRRLHVRQAIARLRLVAVEFRSHLWKRGPDRPATPGI